MRLPDDFIYSDLPLRAHANNFPHTFGAITVGQARALMALIEPKLLRAVPNFGKTSIASIEAQIWRDYDKSEWLREEKEKSEPMFWKVFNDATIIEIEREWLGGATVAGISKSYDTHSNSIYACLQKCGWINPEDGTVFSKPRSGWRPHNDGIPWLEPFLCDGLVCRISSFDSSPKTPHTSASSTVV